MPISGWDPIDPIMNRLQRIDPRSVLDVGIGTGQWGFMVRNYWDFRHNRFYPKDWQVRLTGIEGFANYRNPAWDLYSSVLIGDASQLIPSLYMKYDVAIMIEVLEHFSKEAGYKVLKDLCCKSKHLFISYANSEQGAWGGNDYEIHRACWTDQEILELLPRAVRIHQTSVGSFFYVPSDEGSWLDRTAGLLEVEIEEQRKKGLLI